MKKILSLVLVAVMLVGLMPLSVFADGKATGYGFKLVLSKDTEIFASASQAVSKEVLRLDVMYTTGSNPSKSQVISIDYDASKLIPLVTKNKPASKFGTSAVDLITSKTFSNELQSDLLVPGEEWYYDEEGYYPDEVSEAKFYTTIKENVGYMTFHITQGDGALPYNKDVTGSDYSTLASVYFALKEGVSFDDLPTDLFWLSDIKTDKDITSQTSTICISYGSTSLLWGLEESDNDNLDISPEVALGEGVKFHVEKVNAATPTITNQPTGGEYYKGATATALSVTASVTDAGTLSYKWYKNTVNSTTGGEQVGSEATYTPSTAEVGTAYYFVVVTNTNDAATGTKTASVTSNIVAVTVSEDPDVVALNEAANAIKDLTYEMAQADAADEAAIKAFIKKTAEDAIKNGVTVSVTKASDPDSFVQAKVGTSADPEGTDGSYEFTLTLSINSKTLPLDPIYTLTIKATEFTGITDVQAVAAAKDSIKDGEADVSFMADAEEKLGKAQTHVKELLEKVKEEAPEVEATVALKSGTIYTATLKKGSVTDSVDFTMTFNEAPNPDIAVADAAKKAANEAEYSDTTQEKAPDEDAVKAEVKGTAEAVINNSDVTVEIVTDSYTAPQAGTSAKPSGKDGEYKFKVIVKVKKTADEITRETDEKTVEIKATEYDGLSDEDAVKAAKDIIDAIEWKDIAQADGETAVKVKEFIENKVKEAIGQDIVDVTASVSNFKAAVAGSAATSHEGTKGSFDFTVKAEKGEYNYTTDPAKSLQIIATYFDGVLDKDAVAAAKGALQDGEVLVEFGADQNAKTAAVQTYVEDAIAKVEKAKGVTATVTFVSGNIYSVSLKKNSAEDSKELTMTVIESEDPNIAIIAAAKTAIEGIKWEEKVEDTVFNTDDGAKEYILAIAKNAVNNNQVNTTVTVTDFKSAVDSTHASKDHEGTDGEVKFKVMVKKGNQSYEDPEKTIAINAQDYKGLLDCEAVDIAVEAIGKIKWDDIAQAEGNTSDAVKAIIEGKLAGIENVVITVTISDFKEAVEATAASKKHEGTDGSFKFTVKVDKNAENATPIENKELAIKATAFDGVLDTEAVAAAKDELKDGTVLVEFEADQTAKTAEVQKYVEDLLKDVKKAEGVTATVTFVLGNSYSVALKKNAAEDSKSITMTVNEKEDPDIAIIAAAETAIKGITWEDVPDTVFNTKDGAKEYIINVVKEKIKNDKIEVTVTISYFKAAVDGSASTTHDGTPGAVKFDVKLDKRYQSGEDKDNTINILATKYTGLLDSEAVDKAVEAIGKLNWDDIAQAEGNTEEKVKAIIEGKLAGIENVDIEVKISEFKEAVEATAASKKHEGTDGSFKFTVIVKMNAENATPIENKELAIKATAFNGVLDFEAVAAAKSALKDGEITVPFGSDDAAKTEAVQKHIESYLTGDADGVKAKITGLTGKVYTVKLTKGAEEDTTDITIDVKEEEDPDISLVSQAYSAVDGQTYSDVKQKNINTEELAANKIKELATTALTNAEITSGIDVTVEKVSFKAAVAGDADTTAEGVNGEYKFKVKVTATKGTPFQTTEEKTIAITATAYEGVMNIDAVTAAADALSDKTITVRHGASDGEKTKAVEDYIKSVLTGNATGVTEEHLKSGNEYTVEFKKGTKTKVKKVTIVVEEQKLIDLGKVNGLSYNNRVISWNPVPNASYYKVYVMAIPETNIEHAQVYTLRSCQLDMSDKLIDDKKYTFRVCAMGDLVTYADGTISDASEQFTFKRMTTEEWSNWWILYQLQTKLSVITAEAGEGGTISNLGNKNVSYGDKLKYVITPDEGYEIEAVYVNGKNVGALDLYVFAKVEKDQTIKATFKKIDANKWINPFDDVTEADEYYDAVKFVNEKGLYNGVSATKFAPHSTMTRAMFVTVLGRLAGVDTEKYTETSFNDAELGEWYSAYVEWAAENAIVNGYGNGKFGINDEVTVEQAAAIIARYARFVGIDTANAVLSVFEDVSDLSDWAESDMAWLTESGIYVPKDIKLAPKAKAERSLVATMMYNFVLKFATETVD